MQKWKLLPKAHAFPPTRGQASFAAPCQDVTVGHGCDRLTRAQALPILPRGGSSLTCLWSWSWPGRTGVTILGWRRGVKPSLRAGDPEGDRRRKLVSSASPEHTARMRPSLTRRTGFGRLRESKKPCNEGGRRIEDQSGTPLVLAALRHPQRLKLGDAADE